MFKSGLQENPTLTEGKKGLLPVLDYVTYHDYKEGAPLVIHRVIRTLNWVIIKDPNLGYKSLNYS